MSLGDGLEDRRRPAPADAGYSRGSHSPSNELRAVVEGMFEELELEQWERIREALERRAAGERLSVAELELLIRAAEEFRLEQHASLFRLELLRRELEPE
jgi:hypothetical protein